ncbi:uncharacterized protein K452DRAFT_339648 [Aplosporella prunicola CBS 121167]|uniref:Uncharacterized protein n=1 Tax=Aplosporella prunicola CBS 121167 TaxID=1176127 RepID=A0A6A6B3X5_9PEZI|nr:uncharacterized protein K452DRAFT_339648 [Aplosporella prunicola CBS 121167]KAF2137955.1 hypothetical protein K452DRAFT_339648 [Aplosporella prunicola CBS 121167]
MGWIVEPTNQPSMTTPLITAEHAVSSNCSDADITPNLQDTDHTQFHGSTLQQTAACQQDLNVRLLSTSNRGDNPAASYIRGLVGGDGGGTGIRPHRGFLGKEGTYGISMEGLASLFAHMHVESTKVVEEEYGPSPLPNKMVAEPASSLHMNKLRVALFPGRKKINEPVYERTDSAVRGEIANQPFLYEGLGDQVRELSVGIKLACSRRLHTNSYFGHAYELAEAAAEIACELGYEPLVSRCLYWRGMSLIGLGQFDAAIQSLSDACKARGRYEEGSLAEEQLQLIFLWNHICGEPVEALKVRHMSARTLEEKKEALEARLQSGLSFS